MPHRSVRGWSRRLGVETAVTMVLMGAVPVIIRHLTANVWTIGIVRLAFAVTGITIILALTSGWERPSAREWAGLALVGVLFAAHWSLYFLSVKVSSASMAVIGQSTFGVHLVVLGWLIGHHAVRARDLLAVALAVGGALLAAPRWSLADHGTVGLSIGILSAFFYSFLPILHQRLARLSSFVRVLGQFGFALAIFLLFLPRADFHLPAGDWMWLTVLGVVCTLVLHTLWTDITTRLSTLTTSVIFYLAVPMAIVFSIVFLGERVTPSMLGGAALIVGGNVLALADPRDRRERAPDEATSAA
jgi:drug/metabolite transporter (DMT)-like permease